MNWKRFNKEDVADCDHYLIIVRDTIIHAAWDALNDWFYFPQGDAEVIIRPNNVAYYCEIVWPEGYTAF